MASHETITRPSFCLAQLEDAKDVRALQAAAAGKLTDEFGQGFWSSARTLQIVRQHIEKGRIHLARENGRTCGSFTLNQTKIGFYRKAWFQNPGDAALYLTDMAIHPDHQRQGIGRAAMAEIERLARKAGCKAVRLDAYDGDVGAGPFYEKCGYTEVHRGPVGATKLIYFEKVLG